MYWYSLSGRLAVSVLIMVISVKPLRARSPLGLLDGPARVTSSESICASVSVYGYQCQEFQVTTRDGYILSVQRIGGRDGGGHFDGDMKRQPVILQHGVLVDGMSWMLNSPEQNLPFILADEGFDVWIANARGTRFSRRHKVLDPKQPEFWNWSWDELVAYDLPAVFDYVHSQTGREIHYVGHSLGTLIVMAAVSEGMVVEKLRSAALLSPIAYLSHINTALVNLGARALVGEVATFLGVAEFNPKGEQVGDFLNGLCANSRIDCYDLFSVVTGAGNNCCLNESTVEVFLRNEPQPTSTKNMVHLAQTIRSKVVAKYDYGRAENNLMHYGETKPPMYNFSNIPHGLPIFIAYGGQDALSDSTDVGLLLDSFKFHDVDKLSVQFVKEFAHADFIMGVTAKDIVYNKVISFFKRHNR